MQPLELNLSSRPFKNNTLLWAGYGTAVVVLVLFTFWNLRSYSHHRTLVADLDREVSTIEGQFRDLERRRIEADQAIRGYDLEALAVQAAKADDVIRWKAFSWTRLFNQLEQIQPHDVRMTSIHPIFRSRGDRRAQMQDEQERGIPVSVEGLAKDYAAFLDLERALLADAHFDRVEPSRTARERATQHTIFDLRFSYDPEAVFEEPAALEAKLTTGGGPPADGAEEPPPGDAPDVATAAPPERPEEAVEEAGGSPPEVAPVPRGPVERAADTPEPVTADGPATAGLASDGDGGQSARAASDDEGSAEAFPENPPAQTPPPRVRRPLSQRRPAVVPPRRQDKPRSSRRGSMGGG